MDPLSCVFQYLSISLCQSPNCFVVLRKFSLLIQTPPHLMSLLLFQIDLIFSLFHPFKSRLPSFFSCFFGTFIQHISICVAWVLILLCLCEVCYNHKHYYSNYPFTHAHLLGSFGIKIYFVGFPFLSLPIIKPLVLPADVICQIYN